ncbi:MAG: hypothetical protein F6K28_46000, partial [Microcoleus sp. SIO2G3]|nr:hypothetical protein [Microcoleus sp. SIO2G3]
HLLKDSSRSRLWLCPGGRHFFQYTYAQQLSHEILKFWNVAPIDDLEGDRSNNLLSVFH